MADTNMNTERKEIFLSEEDSENFRREMLKINLVNSATHHILIYYSRVGANNPIPGAIIALNCKCVARKILATVPNEIQNGTLNFIINSSIKNTSTRLTAATTNSPDTSCFYPFIVA